MYYSQLKKSRTKHTKHYKAAYINQLKTNKSLLIVIGISWFFFVIYYIGTDLRHKAELGALKQSETKCMNAYLSSEQSYNEVVSVILEPKDPKSIIKTVFGKDAPLMEKIAMCESGMNPKAKNKVSTARGLFQVMASIHQVQEKWLYNPMINTLIAKELFVASGTSPWNSSKNCWSK